MTEIRFLFRFRDLVAKTIDEHIAIIRAKNACWWGWWKRPSEDNRSDVWKELQSTATNKSPVAVGLFDSGSGKVYRAWVTGVVPPIDDSHSAQMHPTVPKGEEDLIPSYYRSSPFSYAWMRLTEIEDTPMDFFGSYAYAEVPNLPNYTSNVLARFNGKVILEPDELRGMDTTIWKVRPRQPGDAEEKILLTTPALPSAIVYEPVRAKSNVILHITDLHLAVGKNRAQHIWRLEEETQSAGLTMAEAIAAALDRKSIGLIIVTGDLTFTGARGEFEQAEKSLRRLLGILDLGVDHLVVIPGNHDIQWTKSEEYEETSAVSEAPEQARKNYEEFYRNLFRHEPHKNLAMGRRFLLSSGIAVEVCAVNSSSLETGKNFLAGMGRIQEGAFTQVANDLRWQDNSTMALRVLALHHHLVLTEDLEAAGEYYKGFGIAVDATRIQRLAARKGVQLVLHGHKHRAFIWRSSVYELPEFAQPTHQLGGLSIVGGGSSGSIATEGGRNYFNLLEMTASGVHLTIYRAVNKGAFQPMQEWQTRFEIGKAPERLVLTEWHDPALVS